MAEKDSIRITEADDTGYEKRDVSAVKLIVLGGLGLIILTVILVFLYEYFTAASGKMVKEMVLKPQSVALRELWAREAEELNSYKLLDEEKGIYQIPVNRAMELMADEAYRLRGQTSISE